MKGEVPKVPLGLCCHELLRSTVLLPRDQSSVPVTAGFRPFPKAERKSSFIAPRGGALLTAKWCAGC